MKTPGSTPAERKTPAPGDEARPGTPGTGEDIDDEDIMNEAAVEHESAKMLIEQLENMEPDDPNYFATFTVLGEYVMHHVKEEEDEMFPQAKKAEELDLEALGEQMRARKEELTAEATQT